MNFLSTLDSVKQQGLMIAPMQHSSQNIHETATTSKLVISPEEFIAEVNKRMPDIGGYEPGMHVSLYP